MDKFEKKLCIAFGAYLKELRNQAKITQNVVADACNHSNAQFVSNIERGLCWPPMNVLAKMSKLYNVPALELLDNFAEQRKKIWAKEMGIKLNGQS